MTHSVEQLQKIGAYARQQATIRNPLTPATGPFLVIRDVSGAGHDNPRPENLIYGYMFDPDKTRGSNKWGHFPGAHSHIRCSECGARKIPQALSQRVMCDSCQAAWDDKHPYVPEVPRGSPYRYPEGWPEGNEVLG